MRIGARAWLPALLVLPLLATGAGAGPVAQTGAESDWPLLVRLFDRWVQRAGELSLEGSPAPTRTTIAALDQHVYQAVAVFGELLLEQDLPSRPTRTEVVVGDGRIDSSRFFGRVDRARELSRLVVEDEAAAIERDLWLATDSSFKKAVQRFEVKRSALASHGGEPPPPDWSPAPPVISLVERRRPAVDSQRLRRIAIEASARLRRVPGLRHGEVRVRAVEGDYVLVNSEGTRLVRPEGYAAVYAWADRLRDDGVRLHDARQWVVRRPGDLPPIEAIVAEVERMGRRLAARADAETVDYYEGPVLFEGRAAADLLRTLLPPELCGTPPAPSARRSYRQRIRSGPRIGRRLLPAGWIVIDDPTLSLPGLAGGFSYDRQGVRAERVELVRDGYVRDLLMTRVPRHDLQRSNGHARGRVTGSWRARMAQWFVEPPRLLSDTAVRERARRAMRAARLDRLLVVRRLASRRHGRGGLPRPTDAYWLTAEGQRRPVASIEFQRVDRRTLRDILAAGGRMRLRPYLAGGGSSGVTGLPTVIQAPELILVGGMEAVFPGADKPAPDIPQPPL